MNKISFLCTAVGLAFVSSSASAMKITDSWVNFREAYMSGSECEFNGSMQRYP